MCGSLSFFRPFGKLQKFNQNALKNMRNNQCESRDRGVSLALLVTMVMASGVVRQASAQNVPADSQTANSAATPTNQPAWLNPAQSLTFSYGAFDLHPRLRSTTIYDDNILFAHNGRQQDVISQVAPGIQILGGDRQTLETYLNQAEYWNYNLNLIRLAPSYLIVRPPESWPDKFLLLDYSPQWQQFGKHSENDSLDQFVTANAVWPMAKLILGIQESFSDQKMTIVEASTRSKIRQNHTELDAGYQLNDKFSVDTAFVRQDVAYPTSTNLQGYTEWKGSVSLNRQVGPTLNVSWVSAGGLDEIAAGQNQQFVQTGGRARYSYSELFQVDGSLGVEYRQFDTGRADTFTPYFTLGATYQPWERTYFRLGLARQQFASLNDGYFYTSTGGYLTVRRDFTDRFSIWTDLSCYRFDYTPSANVVNTAKPGDYYAMRLTGDLKLWKHLDSQLYYQFSGNGLFQNNSVVQDNQVGLQFTLRY